MHVVCVKRIDLAFLVTAQASVLFDLGYEPALRYMTSYLTRSVQDFGLDVLRLDFNIDPAASWVLKDTQQAARNPGTAPQHGMAEVVRGLHTVPYAVHGLSMLAQYRVCPYQRRYVTYALHGLNWHPE